MVIISGVILFLEEGCGLSGQTVAHAFATTRENFIKLHDISLAVS